MLMLRIAAPLTMMLAMGAAPKPAPTAVLVKPLSEADQARIQESGCESAFVVGPRTYLFAMNNRLVVRTATGAAVCGIDGSIIDAFFEGERPLTCGGVGLALRHTGKRVGHSEADSVSGPASLTITRGTQRQVLRGESGTAC